MPVSVSFTKGCSQKNLGEQLNFCSETSVKYTIYQK